MSYVLILWALFNQEEAPVFVSAHKALVDCQIEQAKRTERFKEELSTDVAKNRGVMFVCAALVPSV
jgi:hypothetical protein